MSLGKGTRSWLSGRALNDGFEYQFAVYHVAVRIVSCALTTKIDWPLPDTGPITYTITVSGIPESPDLHRIFGGMKT